MDNIERLLLDFKDSLEREIRGLEQSTREGLQAVREELAHVNTRFETQPIAELRERLTKVEQRPGA